MNLLNVGQKITLFFQKNTNMVEMVCEIEKIYDDRLDLILPQYFMRYIDFLQVNHKLTAKVFSKFGTVDFNSIIISSPLEESFTIELDYNSMRLTAGRDIPTINAMENLNLKYKNEDLSFKTFEISADYIKFYSEKKLIVGEIVEGTLILPKDYGIIEFKGTIKEVDEIYDNEYTLMLSIMPEESRQNLLYYMYMYNTNSD